MSTVLDVMERELNDALDIVEELVEQGCISSDGGHYSGCIGIYADAIAFLAKHKRCKAWLGFGRNATAWFPGEDVPEKFADRICGGWPEATS